MTQSTLNPTSTKSTYDPYSSVDEKNKDKSDSFDLRDLEDVSAEPVYKLVINENVVEKISSLAAQKIDGIIDMKGNVLSRIQEGLGGADKTKGVDADIVDDAGAKLDLDVILEYGKSAPQVFDEIKKVVGDDLKDMTGLEVIEMTVNVVDVMTPDEYARKTAAPTAATGSRTARPTKGRRLGAVLRSRPVRAPHPTFQARRAPRAAGFRMRAEAAVREHDRAMHEESAHRKGRTHGVGV